MSTRKARRCVLFKRAFNVFRACLAHKSWAGLKLSRALVVPDESRILLSEPLPREHCLSSQPLLCGFSPRMGSLGLQILNILSCPGSCSIAKTPETLLFKALVPQSRKTQHSLCKMQGAVPTHTHALRPTSLTTLHPLFSFSLFFLSFARSSPCFGHFPALSHPMPGVLFHTGRQTWNGGKAPTFPAHGEVTPSQPSAQSE